MKMLRALIPTIVLVGSVAWGSIPVQAGASQARPSIDTQAPAAIASVLTKAGTGDKVLKFRARTVPTVAKITNRGGGNFAIVAYKGTSYDDLLVNEIGSYAGQVYIAPGVNLLKLTSDGAWTVDIKPYTAARRWNGKSAISGKGDAVILLTGGAFGSTVVKNQGAGNFAVIAYGTDGEYLDLLVNEIGAYSGEVLLTYADQMLLSVHAVGGAWSFSRIE
jgi:hypothetical protein